VTPPGIDPGTVQLVAQRLNHYTTLSPQDRSYACINVRQTKMVVPTLHLQGLVLYVAYDMWILQNMTVRVKGSKHFVVKNAEMIARSCSSWAHD